MKFTTVKQQRGYSNVFAENFLQTIQIEKYKMNEEKLVGEKTQAGFLG